ncbi:YbaN family protein [Odoribacter sp. OttesenSCG-928-L07]|nr:YbaN family protein [Odoribacter sp. OttesenSCG-928-L07]MDL2238673.1 YbaN family protein [Bacteroidales bacterium OttesenSCG-928-L14]
MKILFIIFGCISLALGVLGIFLPILPTTPFLLLSSFLFLKSSDRLYNWLLNHKYFGKYIRDFQIHKAIPLSVKITSVSLLWITISISAIFFVEMWWLRILLFAIAIGVTVHILSFKTRR